MKNILVTGATGFLGQKLSLKLHSLGHNVICVGRNAKIGQLLHEKGVQFVQLELQDPVVTQNICSSIDYVFHCAALSSPWGRYEDFYQANVMATKNLLQSAKKHQVKRFIHVSTPSIYFDYKDRYDIKESDPLPLKPCNGYAATKLLAEHEVEKSFAEGLPAITIRPRGIFGPGDTAVFPRILKAHTNGGIPLINKGNALIDITYVDNVVDALLLCMDSPESTLGKKYNITNGSPIFFRELLEILAKNLDIYLKTRNASYGKLYCAAAMMEWISKWFSKKEPILTRYSVGILAFSQTLDITAARHELGYRPHVTIEEGVGNFAKWWTNDRE